MPYADSEGIRIHYQMEGEGPPLVLHHWSLATMNDWYDYGYVSALRNEYRLVLLDARGHGDSDKLHSPGAYELSKRVKDVVAVLDDLGISRAHFFGYSMGGWIGFGIVRYAPERLRSIIIGGQHPYKQSMTGLRKLVQYGVENGPEAFIAIWEENFGTLSFNKAKERMLKYDYRALLVAAQDRESLGDVLTAMDMPCLLYAGEMDEVYPIAKKCAQQIANAKFVSLPGLGHGGAISRSDEILPHIHAFLSVVSKGTSEV